MTAIAVVLALAMPQGMTVDPGVVRIPAGQQVLDKWPDYYTDPQVGYQTFKITYTVPATGIKMGGSVAFGLGYMAEDLGNNPAYSINSGWMFGPTETMARFPIGQIQRNSAAAANYCTASSSKGFVTVSTLTHSNYGREVLLKVTANSFMTAGTVWTVKLGDTHWGGPGMSLSWEPGMSGWSPLRVSRRSGIASASRTPTRIWQPRATSGRRAPPYPAVGGQNDPPRKDFDSNTGTLRAAVSGRFVIRPSP
jgi:hypothetical protein